jgi:hypothetical protein
MMNKGIAVNAMMYLQWLEESIIVVYVGDCSVPNVLPSNFWFLRIN